MADEKESVSEPNYNPLFEKLVDVDEDGQPDVEGLIAYGLYKIAKREWVSDFRKRYGRKPRDKELDEYVATWTPSQIQGAKNGAEQILAKYAFEVIQEEEKRMLREALKGSFWHSVWTSIVANAIYTLILIALAIVLARSGVDLVGILKDAAQ